MIKVTQTSAKVSETIHLRPSKSSWGLITFFSVIGLAPLLLSFAGLLPKTLSVQLPLGLYAAIFLVPCALFGYWQMRAVMVADDTGLRWRGLGKWQTASWSEITDYYEKLTPTPKPAIAIVMQSLKLSINPGLWEEPTELKQMIARKALTAKVTKWGLLGTRSKVDWPCVFDYNTKGNPFQTILYPVATIFAAVYLIWCIGPGAIRTAATLGWGWGAATLALGGLSILPLVLLIGVVYQMHRSSISGRQGQRITLTQEGVIYQDDQHKVEALWGDISDLQFTRNNGQSYHYVVVSRQGTFDFSPSIKDSAVLSRALTTFATALPKAEWRRTESDTLDGKASNWSSRCEGIGKRIYHYRTRTNRALLWFPSAITLFPTVLYWALAPLGLMAGNIDVLLFFDALMGWGWWRYWKAGIETDSEGITQRTLLGSRFLSWDTVEDYSTRGDNVFKFGVVEGAKTRVWFSLLIADIEELKSEIQRQAINSLTRNWDRDSQDEQKK